MIRRTNFRTLLAASLAVILLFSAGAKADGLTVYGNAVKFANPAYDSLVRVDFPFSIERQQFMFSPLNDESGGLFARIFADVVLYSSADGLPVDSTSRLFLTRVDTPEQAKQEGVRIFNFLTMFVKPGLYTARITVIDADSKAKGEFFIERLKVQPPERSSVRLSELMLSYDVRYVGDDSTAAALPQVKNGFYITPNPSRVFAATDSTIHIYAEAYNLGTAANAVWTVSYLAYDARGEEFLGLGSRVLKSPGESAVITDRFDIKGWPTGVYSLHATIADKDGRHSSSIEVPFRIISKEEVEAVAASYRKAEKEIMPGDPYNRLTTREKEQLVGYLLTPVQKSTLAGLNDVGKENFMAQFWREHDIDPTTPEIENRLELLERYKYVLHRFSTDEAETDGWRQDRGRVYMIYGPPDKLNDFQAPMSGSPFQIWYYYAIDEGKHFVFVDQFENGDYLLVHSNVYGEPQDKAWETMIREGVVDEMDREN